MKIPKFYCLVAVLIIVTAGFAAADDASLFPGLDTGPVGLEVGIGTETIGLINYQTLSLFPDIDVGDFGVGFAFTLHYRNATDREDIMFYVRERDWVPENANDIMEWVELYLPKIMYIRYGQKSEPLYVKLGTIDDGTLGNGFILGNYSNALFLPEKRIFGAEFRLDGKAFDFPYAGIQTFAGNLANPNLFGTRLYTRPIYWTDLPVFKELQFGVTGVVDINPYAYISEEYKQSLIAAGAPAKAEPVYVFGAGVKQPILNTPVLSLAAFGDVAFQTEDLYPGGSIGFGGKLISLFTYGAQLRFIGENFIPTYFDGLYDLERANKYAVIATDSRNTPQQIGWFASLGTTLLEEKLIFNVSLEGPTQQSASLPVDDPLNWPHLRAAFLLDENIIPKVSVEAYYDKKVIKDFSSLIDPANALIGAKLNYKMQPVVISLTYDVIYNPELSGDEKWDVTSKIETSVSLF